MPTKRVDAVLKLFVKCWKAIIQTLFERRNGLNELAKILTSDNTELYEKLVKDMGETSTKFQNWWNRMSKKYQ